MRTKCLGYALGNAIESLSGYTVQHGLALAQGIGITARASAKMKWCSDETSSKILNALSKNNLPSECRKFTAREISQSLLNGRKISGSGFELVILSEIGRCEVKVIGANELEEIILSGMTAGNVI